MMKHLLILVLFLLNSPALAEGWDNVQNKDEMTGEASYFAMSPSTKSSKPMGFPLSDTSATLVVGCKEGNEWAYAYFSNQPILSGDITEDGYDVIYTRLKIDDELKSVKLTQTWGSNTLHFAEDIISRIPQSKEIWLELDWYGEGKRVFKFSMGGSASAMAKMREQCSK